ncbi:hypothetical protein O7606_12205 [Micromonospora sp. WMMD882]|uniref:hypothetical protein n=1 Tax=Micromonospora sp. WMMD882 TaxID=3015151 RepID=UPI00248AA606|nr:hypothetical protein [Micromonospora sp. WMMD882]WBB82052.1 hypothetical protein O7606_12205 [Micromonospora sp. WMMD882]
MGESLTAEERLILRAGAFGAVYLVSNADPGLLGMIRESFAASGVIMDAQGVVRQALTSGPLPRLPQGPAAQVESAVLTTLGQALAILRAKAPAEVAAYRSVVLTAADRVARAHRGVDPAEQAAIERVRTVLDSAP